MKNTHYKNFNMNGSFSDFDGALRYLKGKDQVAIKEDDPEFFSILADGRDDTSMLSSSRRILRKIPRKQRKEERQKS